MRNAVGLVEMTPMTKFEVSGPGAEAWLDGILANRLPKTGRVNLSHHLTKNGGVQAEYVVARLEDGRSISSRRRAPNAGISTTCRSCCRRTAACSSRNVTNERGCFTIVGPKARDVLQTLTEIDLSNEAFPWFGVKSGDRRAGQRTFACCASTMKASWAGSSIIRSPISGICSRRSWRPANRTACGSSASMRWSRCASKNPIAPCTAT